MEDELLIAAYKEIVFELCEAKILTDYGVPGLNSFKVITERLGTIHHNIDYKSKEKIIVIKSIDGTEVLPSLFSDYERFSDPSRLTAYSAKEFIIEITNSGSYLLHNSIPTVTSLNNQAIVYQWEPNDEAFVGKSFIKNLTRLPGTYSYFAIKTFKTLDDALEFYKINYALNASCEKLSESFESPSRIYFAPSPEEILRDSLHKFLKARIRENVAVEREQNMDASHPVDIKVTWNYTSHMAIIEVKWLGSSYDSSKNTFVNHSQIRANKGAKQLAEYLEMINTSVTNKITRGYLVVFDIRRKKAHPYKASISKSDGLNFENIDIVYKPEYNIERTDFEKPHRFFIKPYSLY